MSVETLGLELKLYKDIKVGETFYFQPLKEENLNDISKLEIFKRVVKGPGWTAKCVKSTYRTRIEATCFFFNNETEVLAHRGIVIII